MKRTTYEIDRWIEDNQDKWDVLREAITEEFTEGAFEKMEQGKNLERIKKRIDASVSVFSKEEEDAFYDFYYFMTDIDDDDPYKAELREMKAEEMEDIRFEERRLEELEEVRMMAEREDDYEEGV